MTTVMIFHEVNSGEQWAKAWRRGEKSRHEMFGQHGIKARTFQDPSNPNATGVLLEIPDMATFQQWLASDEGKKAMAEDGLKGETVRMLVEFTP